MLRILFVANGHGETAIAARIAGDVARLATEPVALDLVPLVGTGGGAAPLTPIGPRRTMPSGGLVAMGNVRAFSRDLRAGFLRLLGAQLAFLRGTRGSYDAVVAVGDAYALALALPARTQILFVGTAKSVYVAPYGPFERTLLRRALRVFVRDEPTARRLREQRVEAEAPGNVIVDLIGVTPGRAATPGGAAPSGEWIGVLPGSRETAYGDAVRLARVVKALGRRRPGPGALLSVAPTLDAARFARELLADGWQHDDRLAARGGAFGLRSGAASIVGWTGPLGALLHASVIVLGQAGTANEQAAAAGVPVVALGESAPEFDDWYRMRQRRLLGSALLLVPTAPESAAVAIADLLDDPDRLSSMGAAGRARMGPGGGAEAIARAILEAAEGCPSTGSG